MSGYTKALDDSSDIVVPQDDYGLYAIDSLDTSFWIKCLRVTDAYHFHDMINMLIDYGYKKGTTLFGYGYDFRQSNRIGQLMDGLKEKLEVAYEASGGRKVNLISHSTGGLLVSCFISLHSDVFAKYVNKWITIATPFQECPSIYEMLPNPDFKWEKQPTIAVWRKVLENGQDSVKRETYGISRCVELFEDTLKENQIEYNKKTINLPFNHDIYKWATTTRKMLNYVQLPEGIDFYNLYGTSYDVPFDVCYGSETDPINDAFDVCYTFPEFTFVDGDGLVPAESAMVLSIPSK
ncbi:hypothetical protein QVD17_28597 [Tagetes erecta]|uniref:Uncharacterized protein n=1 Tax=Tagetes erecta TaxID=13708 RepID=A0AAD8NKL6_TARER|nr:hypothetical protein QVD17_28597 [Tagetes erecta]